MAEYTVAGPAVGEAGEVQAQLVHGPDPGGGELALLLQVAQHTSRNNADQAPNQIT
jgi:hypothetical protein